MEHLWSRAVATHGNRRQARPPRKRLNYLRTVADDCHRLRWMLHGKEGVDGSSPSEGLRFLPAQSLGEPPPQPAASSENAAIATTEPRSGGRRRWSSGST